MYLLDELLALSLIKRSLSQQPAARDHFQVDNLKGKCLPLLAFSIATLIIWLGKLYHIVAITPT